MAKGLFEYYKDVHIEQNMVPEFSVPDTVEDFGLYEEELCWKNVLMQLQFFYNSGLRNIIALDFDDIRTRELPVIFKGYDYITLKLISSDSEQIRQQMEHRKETEGGLYLPDYVDRVNAVIKNRKLLPNEKVIDIAGKTKEQVLQEAIHLIDGHQSIKVYEYVMDDASHYLSWVQSRQLV